MDRQTLVRMANDIAAFFAADPDPEQAAAAVADHLRRFWEPRMRGEILAHLQAGGGGLHPIAEQAVRKLAAA